LRALRECRYQVGIDFYPFFPPIHPLFYQARIPVRIGFESGGFGPLLTHPIAWRNADVPFTQHLRDLLVAANCAPPAGAALRFHRLPPAGVRVPLRSGRYVILHPGSGAPAKDWGLDNWRELAARLRARGEIIVLTGAGAQERETARKLEDLADSNFVDALDWKEFADVVGSAKAVICPDTAAGHLAAVFDVPTVAVFTGTNNMYQWAPNGPRAKAVLTHVTCAPCYRAGCKTMPCIRGTSPSTVLAALDAVMAAPADWSAFGGGALAARICRLIHAPSLPRIFWPVGSIDATATTAIVVKMATKSIVTTVPAPASTLSNSRRAPPNRTSTIAPG
jgi:ADP-heptose:LPS heptosyltransferase